MSCLEVINAGYAYNNGLVLKGISLEVKRGGMVGLLGPNGSGKTTLLKIISGILKPKYGEIKLKGQNLNAFSRNEVAKSIAVVPQEFNTPFAFTVAEVVALGRTPFRKFLNFESVADREAISRAMELTGITSLKERRFDNLSGGERQKVVLGAALAQEPEILLLDEPTVHLDIAHQVEFLECVRELNSDGGLTVIAAMHDLNLAACYFERLVLLKEGKVIASGKPREVLTEPLIKEAFNADVRVEPDTETGAPHIYLTPHDPKKASSVLDRALNS